MLNLVFLKKIHQYPGGSVVAKSSVNITYTSSYENSKTKFFLNNIYLLKNLTHDYYNATKLVKLNPLSSNMLYKERHAHGKKNLLS